MGDYEERLKREVENLSESVAKLNLKVQSLEERLDAIQKGEFGSGVYLEGSSPLVQKYVRTRIEPKVESEV